MSDPDRPPVGRRVLEQIELMQYQVDRQFWPMIASYRVVPSDIAKLALPPPRTPMTLLDSLRAYASMLFKREADQYGQFIGDRNYAPWLAKVEERVIARVFRTIAAIEQEKKPATLAYHGLTDVEISQELGQILFEIRSSYVWTDTVRLAQTLSPPLPPDVRAQMEATAPDDPKTWPLLRQKVAAFIEIKKLMQAPKLEIPERLVRETIAEQKGIRPEDVTFEQIRFEVSGLLPTYPAISLIPETTPPASAATQTAPGGDSVRDADVNEVQRRATLLEEYKAATGNPSNKRIYEARNSGLYKPQFIQWRRGELPNTSATTQNFERFLRAKRPPMPRKPKP